MHDKANQQINIDFKKIRDEHLCILSQNLGLSYLSLSQYGS